MNQAEIGALKLMTDAQFAETVELDLSEELSKLDLPTLKQMQQAGEEMAECLRVLDRVGRTLIHEVIDGETSLEFYTHYPKSDDVRDEANNSQYYYHHHRDDPQEHGHFHLYVRSGGIPQGVVASNKYNRKKWPPKSDQFAQLFVISLDPQGLPCQIFTNNRWVAHETFFEAPQLIRLLDGFKIDHAWPSWPLNRWISAFPMVFRPQIEAAIFARDRVIKDFAQKNPVGHVLEDERLEVTSIVKINFEQQISQINQMISTGGLC
ncbi:hypothetical protein AB833_07310 [Chromatiales bacterium (ex Bugula neritina AB1)]|nr:hypothetical protein AB833_07310 [Chromatiales bacterium (ex Bugula neritina AB1)]